jgi:preprotein translocase subunit SecD
MLIMNRRGLIAIMLLALSACNPLPLTPPPPADGAILVLEVDGDSVRAEALSSLSELMAGALRGAGVRYSGRGAVGDVARVVLVPDQDSTAALQTLRSLEANGGVVFTLNESEGSIEARFTDEHFGQLLRQSAENSAAVISRRFSPAYPESIPIALIGGGRFTVQAPRNAIPDDLPHIATTPGLLSFHLVTDRYDGIDRMPPGYFLAQPHPAGQGHVEIVRERHRSPASTSNAQRRQPIRARKTGCCRFSSTPRGPPSFAS